MENEKTKTVLYLSKMPVYEGDTGLFNLSPEIRNKLMDLLMFNETPTQKDITTRALKVISLLKEAGHFPPQKIMLDLVPAFISTFERVLSVNGYEIVYLFYSPSGPAYFKITNGRTPTMYYEGVLNATR